MNETLKHKGRMQELDLKNREIALRMEGLIGSIRDILDPFAHLADLRCDIAAEQAVQLAELQIQYKANIETISAIKKALGQ